MHQELIATAVALAAAAAAGCNITPTKAYEGASRPARELAFLKGGAVGEEMNPIQLNPVTVVNLSMIDGAAHRDGTYYASVLPGRRWIGVEATLRIGTRRSRQFCALEIDALAGCTYTPSAPSAPSDAANGPWEWSVDMLVGATCADGAAFQARLPARCGSSAKVFERKSP